MIQDTIGTLTLHQSLADVVMTAEWGQGLGHLARHWKVRCIRNQCDCAMRYTPSEALITGFLKGSWQLY